MKTGEEGEGWVELKERLMMREGGREGGRDAGWVQLKKEPWGGPDRGKGGGEAEMMINTDLCPGSLLRTCTPSGGPLCCDQLTFCSARSLRPLKDRKSPREFTGLYDDERFYLLRTSERFKHHPTSTKTTIIKIKPQHLC